MKKLDERSQWENEWADAFRNEKQKAPAHVWHNIDAVLANKDAEKYKKRAVFYKWLAAASVFISACGAVLLFLSSPQNTTPSGIAGSTPVEQTPVEPTVEQTNEQQNAAVRAEKGLAGTENTDKSGEISIASQGAGISAGGGASSPAPSVEKMEKTRPVSRESEKIAEGTHKSREIEGGAENLAIASEDAPAPAAENADEVQGTSVPAEFNAGAVEGWQPDALAGAEQRRRKSPASLGDNISLIGTEPALSSIPEESGAEKSSYVAQLADQKSENELINRGSVGSLDKVAFLELEKKGMELKETNPAGLDIRVQKVWMASDLLKKKSEGEVPRYWLGASLATNSFNPNFQQEYMPSSSFASLEQSVRKPEVNSRLQGAQVESWDESQEAMVSFAGGVQGAAWLSEKWLLQTGLQYGTYKSSGKAAAFVDKNTSGAYPLHYSNFNMENMDPLASNSAFAENVSAINTFEFLSVPLSIGYVLLDQKLGLIVAPGLSSEFFLSNNLSDSQNLLNDYEVKGSNSPYNLVHLRGMMGLQLFYRVGENYIVSLEPAYQHSITDFNKSESNFNSRPSNITLGAGFKYIIQ